MNEKSFGINVDIEDLTYPLAIEKEIRLRSHLAMFTTIAKYGYGVEV